MKFGEALPFDYDLQWDLDRAIDSYKKYDRIETSNAIWFFQPVISLFWNLVL